MSVVQILCVGGCHWDIRLTASQPFVPGESIPVKSKRSPGGAVSNVARALREQGYQVDVASVVGRDPPELSPHSLQLMNRDSGRYYSVEHKDGSLAHGLADLDLYQEMDAQWHAQLSAVSDDYDAVIIDSNAQPQALQALITSKPLYALAVSPPKVRNLVTVLERLDTLFLNEAESEQLGSDLIKVQRVVRTLGEKGLELMEYGDVVARYPGLKRRPSHVNGLGDRLAGLTISRILKGEGWSNALCFALENLLNDWE